MRAVELEAGDGALAVRRQLERVLTSPGFVRNERLCRFLGLMVEWHLDGRDRERKAIELAPLSADAHGAMGMMQARESQWKNAERSFRRSIELAPREPLCRDHFALFFLLPLGRVEEALGQLREAEKLDPSSRQTHRALDSALRSAGRLDEADHHCQQSGANDRDRSTCWAQTLLRQGKTGAEQAIRILEPVWSGHLLDPGAAWLGVAYAKAGRREDAERMAAVLPRPASKARIFAALGDEDRTFEALDRMVPMGPTRLGRDVMGSPEFAFLSGDPRWNALRRKVGLPE